MGITISYKNITYDKNNIVYKLFNIILNNTKILKVISNIYILEGSQKEKLSENLMEYKTFLEKVIKSGIMTGNIKKEEATEFLELWCSINNEKLGLVLEQLISGLGPYNGEELIECDKSMSVEIDEVNEKNNFDVVFFNKCFSEGHSYGEELEIQGYSEFHECKKNVCTFIPIDCNAKLKEKVGRKLIFIKKTHDLQKEGKYYIPTFYPIVNSQKKFLDEYDSGKFSFIEILSVDDLFKRYAI